MKTMPARSSVGEWAPGPPVDSLRLPALVGALGHWLISVLIFAAVALYLYLHRGLVLMPLTELAQTAQATSSPASQPIPLDVFSSFFQQLWPPLVALMALVAFVWPWSRLYDDRGSPRFLATLIVVSALIVISQTALGSAERLTPIALRAVTGAVIATVAAAGFVRWLVNRRDPAKAWAPTASLLDRLELRSPSRLGLALGGLTLLSWVVTVLIAALVPPFGWDTLVYHLTDIFSFAATGTLEPFAFPAHQFLFPKVGELHSLWFFLLAGGGDQAWRVTGIALAPLALLAGVAARTAAEALELRRALPWIVPAVVLTPMMIIQPLAGYVDGAFAAFLLATFAFAIRAARNRRPSDLAFCALSAGLALGAKISFLYFCLPVIVVLLNRRAIADLLERRPVRRLVLWAMLFAVGCGFWLIPNALETGNPFHPLAIGVGPMSVFDGPVEISSGNGAREQFTDTANGWWIYPLLETFRGVPRYNVDTGFGPQFAAAYVALPFALLFALRGKRKHLLPALLATPLIVVPWLVLSPFEHPRYVLAASGFLVLALAVLLEQRMVPEGSKKLVETGLVLALLFSAVAGTLSAAPELTTVIARLQSGTWSPEAYYPLHYGRAGRAFNWFSDPEVRGATIATNSGLFVAPLFGWHGQNRVVYVASADDPPVGTAPVADGYSSWRRELAEESADWLAFWEPWWSPSSPATRVDRWILAHEQDLPTVASFGHYGRIHSLPALVTQPTPRRPRDRPADLVELSRAEDWVVEYSRGATALLGDDAADGLRIDYSFQTPGNDYLDLRYDLSELDWPESGQLRFNAATSEPTLLFVYLKEADPKHGSRYRVDLEPGRTAVALDLSTSDWRSPGFDPARTAAVHLVVDDLEDSDQGSGSLRLAGFRLEPTP